MKSSKEAERLFKDIASRYVERAGEGYQRELAELESKLPDSASLSRKVGRKMFRIKLLKLSYAALPAAAVILLFVIFSLSSTPSRQPEVDSPAGGEGKHVVMLSAELPEGYRTEKIDYDQNKTIYHLVNEMNSPIILTAELNGIFDKSEFQNILINGTEAYVLIKKDYSVLAYESGEVLYTLTSPYDYRDLVALTKGLT